MAAIDYSSPVGKIRLLIADLDPDAPLLADDVLEGYLSLNGENLYRAAADALDAMATSEVLISRKIRTQDLSTDGPAVATALRQQAASLRAKADAEDASGGDYFEFFPSRPFRPLEGSEWPV